MQDSVIFCENLLNDFCIHWFILVYIQDTGDEVTWQTYKGQLTEKQEKTRGKILKRTEKASAMILITCLLTGPCLIK